MYKLYIRREKVKEETILRTHYKYYIVKLWPENEERMYINTPLLVMSHATYLLY